MPVVEGRMPDTTKDLERFTVFAPIVLRVRPKDAAVVEAIFRTIRELDACPTPVLEALEAARTDEIDRRMLRAAKLCRSREFLRAAARGGSPEILAARIELARDRRAKLRESAIQALDGSGKVRRSSPELENLVLRELSRANSTRLKAALVRYLSMCGAERHRSVFADLARPGPKVEIRLAAVGALSICGKTGRETLVEELADKNNDVRIRRACLLSLGSIEDKAVAPLLIHLLQHPDLSRTAHRALRRLAGRDLGRNREVSNRWWRQQSRSSRAVSARDA